MIGGSIRKYLGLFALVLGSVFAVPAVASANNPPNLVPDCKAVVVTLTDRPDSGNHGTWATDQITRTVKVCHAVTTNIASNDNNDSWYYTATVVDDGRFVTVAGAANSPNKGDAIGHVVPGWMGGTFTATFTAPHHWGGWLGSDWNGKTLNGAAGTPKNPSTSTFIKALWKYGFEGNAIDNDWTWTYWTCSKSLDNALERWTDSYKTDGSGPKDGDIVGKVCPSPSPSPSVSPSTVPTTTPTITPSPTEGGLPVTGTKTDWLVAGGGALALLGVCGVVVGRRRRTRFEA